MKAKYRGIKHSGIGKSSASQPTGSTQNFSDLVDVKSNTYNKNQSGGGKGDMANQNSRMLRLQKNSPLWPTGNVESPFANNKNKSGMASGSQKNPVNGKSGANGSNSNSGMGLGKSGNRGGFSASTKGASVTTYGMKKPINKNQRLG